MNLNQPPTEVAEAMLRRSQCHVQVGACLADDWGIHAWGWNGMGPTGMGEHAEAMCLKRANRDRIEGSTLYVAARRHRNGKIVTARPCDMCWALTLRCKKVMYRDGKGIWGVM